MRPRKKNNTTIEYFLVANGSPSISPIVPPTAFKNNVIEFLKDCPQDLLQVINSMGYYENYLRELWSYGYDFNIFNIDNYKSIKTHIDNSIQVQLFFLDGKTVKHIELYKTLSQTKDKCRFFYFYNRDVEIRDEYIINSPFSFIEGIIKKQDVIFKEIGISNLTIEPTVSLEYKGFNDFYYFVPTKTNFLLINKIIGNFFYTGPLKEQELILKISEESAKANLDWHSFERLNKFNIQLKKIDFFINVAYANGILKPASPIEPFFSPLIIVLPFHNPDLKHIYDNEDIIKSMQLEQTENYINVQSTKKDIELTLAGMEFQRERIKYLDDVSFLHSSLTFSPVIRLPIKGASIYRELSFFGPKAFSNYINSNNRKKLKKSICNFGKILNKKILSPELTKTLTKRNGQIVAISDLPVEWLLVSGIPFSFTHDICRLPETSLHGLMSFYTYNQNFEFSISKDVLKKTLVILGTNESPFLHWQSEAKVMSKEKGFIVKECSKIKEVIQIIHDCKPEIIIFDCHGGYDETTRSTYLLIGNEKLDGESVIKNKIFAPIVFLSACGTAPTYGTMNPIANAFFEAGAISVTSTYLPISVEAGSVLYLRILNKLDYASKKCIHKNWLEFVCHVIRTSSLNEAYGMALKKTANAQSKDYADSNIEALIESLSFSKRRYLFNDLDNKIKKLTNDNRSYYSEVIPEYLLYSNLGRGDLILFDTWRDKFLNTNAFDQSGSTSSVNESDAT
jgi:hypothetical protein